MDEQNSALQNDMVFAETNTTYDFYELEEAWEEAHCKKEHPVKKFIHKITDEGHAKKHTQKKD